MLTETLIEKGFTVALDGDRLAVTPKTRLTDDLRDFIRSNKSQLISELQSSKTKDFNNLWEIKTNKLHAELNQLIKNGVTFDVSAEDFQIIINAQILKTSDKEFLKLNYSDVLCQLQQSLLMKRLFSIEPEKFEEFAADIYQHEDLAAKAFDITFQIHCDAVKAITKKWYEALLSQL